MLGIGKVWPTGPGQVGGMIYGVVTHRAITIINNIVADISKICKRKDIECFHCEEVIHS